VKIAYLADEDLRHAIVLGVRRREPLVSFIRIGDLGAAGRDDLAILQIASEQGRILVSHDFKTMPQHFHQFISRLSSPGVLLIPQTLALNRAIEDLITIWVASEAEEWENQLYYLPL